MILQLSSTPQDDDSYSLPSEDEDSSEVDTTPIRCVNVNCSYTWTDVHQFVDHLNEAAARSDHEVNHHTLIREYQVRWCKHCDRSFHQDSEHECSPGKHAVRQPSAKSSSSQRRWNCPVLGCSTITLSKGTLANHLRQAHAFLSPAEMNTTIEQIPGLTTCTTCHNVFTVEGLKRHNCTMSSRLHEVKFSWAYCPFFRLMLLYSPGNSYGTEEGIPTALRSLASRAAAVLHEHPHLRQAIHTAFRTGSGHAYISGAKQNSRQDPRGNGLHRSNCFDFLFRVGR